MHLSRETRFTCNSCELSCLIFSHNIHVNLEGFWHGFVSGPELFFVFDIVLPHSRVSSWSNVTCTFMTTDDLDAWPPYQKYIFTMNLCLGKIVFARWHRHTKGTWVYHHVTRICIHSWHLYPLGLDLYCGVGGILSE